MSALQSCVKILCRNSLRLQLPATHFVSQRWQTSADTSAHTLAVRQKISEKKQKALLGGGEKRIQTQHKKVNLDQLFLCMLPPILYAQSQTKDKSRIEIFA
jgi:hypothetical protein